MIKTCWPQNAADAEFAAGYADGKNPDSPLPGENRSACYRHGFANGRDDLRHSPRASAEVLRKLARQAEIADGFRAAGHPDYQEAE